MKRIYYLFIAISIMVISLSSCEDPILPTADFTFSPAEVEIYQEVTFTNTSSDSDSFAWDFGDGESSTEENPTHVYTTGGTYTVKLIASNIEGSETAIKDITVTVPANVYTLDDVQYDITTDMFWYQSAMPGSSAYIRLLTDVSGQDNPDLLKLYPNKGLNELPGTYTWDAENPEGTYDFGYTANYAGMAYDWTAIGKTGSQNLVVTELESGIYKIEMTGILSVGSYDFSTGEFTETGTKDLELFYLGAITPLSAK
jgi:PKD repeat protein